MADLRSLVPPGTELSDEQKAKIDTLQQEIDEIWSRKGDYKQDPDAWKTMPIFMDEITPADAENNENIAALQAIAYEGIPPEELAQRKKDQGNKAMQLALDPNQPNKMHIARTARDEYSEGIKQKCGDTKLNSQLYANRSMANFMLQQYGHALEDGQRSIILDRTYTKAYYRAAKAAEKVKKFAIARDLIAKGLETNPNDVAKKEFEELITVIDTAQGIVKKVERKQRIRCRATAAENSNIIREIQRRGIVVSPFLELNERQFTMYDSQIKPHVAPDGVLVLQLLLLYDEYQQSDFLHEVPTDACLLDILAEVMPFPWDDKGRYDHPDKLVAVYIIDDGVAMPKYYSFDPNMSLLEVFRSPTYVMPGVVPCVHLLPKDSDYARQWGVV